ncbi:MAG: hypothetical protein U0K60_08390 [Parafannyhessea umbonata]|nr:hypothetical protein [Parafannyhessea umbonata]
MAVVLTYKVREIMKTPRYRAMVDSNRYDVTDPTINELVCNYCWLADKVEECRSIIDREGIMVEGLHGNVQNPAQGSTKAYLQMMNIIIDQLKKMSDVKPESADALDDFLGGE